MSKLELLGANNEAEAVIARPVPDEELELPLDLLALRLEVAAQTVGTNAATYLQVAPADVSPLERARVRGG